MLADTIDPKLDMKTFQVLDYSSQNTVEVRGNVLTVSFPNINLPDSAGNPQGSIGFVQYRIKPKTALVPESRVKNTAYVYFRF